MRYCSKHPKTPLIPSPEADDLACLDCFRGIPAEPRGQPARIPEETTVLPSGNPYYQRLHRKRKADYEERERKCREAFDAQIDHKCD